LTQGERRYGKIIGWDFDIGDHLHVFLVLRSGMKKQ